MPAKVVYRFRVVIRGLAIASALLVGCAGKASREDCREILEHYLDLSLATDPELQQLPPPQAEAVRAMKRAVKLGEASFRKVELRCEAEVTGKQVRCARKAATADEWQACID